MVKKSTTKITDTRRSVADAKPPTALDLAIDEGEDAPAPKQAAKRVGSLTAPAAPVADEDDLDEDDDEDDDEPESSPRQKRGRGRPRSAVAKTGPVGGGSVNAAFWAEANKLGPAHAKAVTTRKVRQRILTILKALQRWELGDEAHMKVALNHLENADAHVAHAVNALEMVSHDWRPKKAKRVQTSETAKLSEGTVVAVREKAMKNWAGLEDDPTVFARLTVKQHAGSKVVALTADGTRYVFPRAHLTIVAEGA